MTLQRRLIEIGHAFRRRFGGDPTVLARAPGRVDLMGSHTDYNDGYVLTMTIDMDTIFAASPRSERVVRVVSLDLGEEGVFSLDAPEYPAMPQWLRYVAGVCSVLLDQGHAVQGFDCAVQSTVPIGGGLSSSAALEASVAVGLASLNDLDIAPVDLAQYCRRAENEFAGMNCGILDQYTSILGEAGAVILLDCRALTHRPVRIPKDLHVVVCDTHAPHVLTGSEYGTRRAQCEEGVRAIRARHAGVRALRDVSLEQLAECAPDLSEDVERRCRFVIQENQRVLDMARALDAGDRARMSALNRESFSGARDLYEISVPAMEAMVEAMLSCRGVIGARQAGAGFGGCMTALVEAAHAEEFVRDAPRRYQKLTGLEPDVYVIAPAAGAGLCPL